MRLGRDAVLLMRSVRMYALMRVDQIRGRSDNRTLMRVGSAKTASGSRSGAIIVGRD